MSKTYLIIISVLSITLVLTNGSSLVFRKVEKYLGDSCSLDSGLEGKCVKAKECTTITSRINLTRCEFEINDLIICCPVIEEITGLDYENIDGSTYDAPSDLTRSRFNEVLCENKTTARKYFPNIVGGSEAEIAEFPYQVALGYQSEAADGTYDFNCGGSLILDDIVITAAHCAHLKSAQPVIVRLGRASLVESEYDHGPIVDVGIKKIMVHEHSKRATRQNDIALIKLTKKVEFTHFIKPICISRDNDAWNKNLTVMGFGLVDPDNKRKSTWLMKGIVQEVEIEDCRNSFKIVSKTIYDSQICAFGKFGTDACQGDSGGPLILEENNQDRLFGITSHGNGCRSGLPALYTRVDQFLTWIEKTINILDQLDNELI